jgi:hypothetical protein
MGRVIVDVPEGSSPVYLGRLEARPVDNGPTRRKTFAFFDLPDVLLCEGTPCVVDHAPGNILLGFPVAGCTKGMDYDLVHVGPHPSVYRRSLSILRDDTGAERIVGIVAASLGVAGAITGLALVGASDDGNKLALAGGITLGAGALVTTIGVLMIRHDSPTYRPGSANHFDPEAPMGSPQPVPPRPSALDVPTTDCVRTSRGGVGAG